MKQIKGYFYKIAFLIVDLFRWISNFLLAGEMEKRHILFQKTGNQIKLVIKSHDEFATETQNRINRFKNKKNDEKYVEFALKEAIGGCNYIIISKGERFVQFWTNRGRLEFDFPIVKGNGNKKYYYQVLGLLASMDFVRDSFVPSQIPSITKIMPNHTYKTEVYEDMTLIKGFFNKMTDKATKFTLMMFSEIYKSKRGKFEIRVE